MLDEWLLLVFLYMAITVHGKLAIYQLDMLFYVKQFPIINQNMAKICLQHKGGNFIGFDYISTM